MRHVRARIDGKTGRLQGGIQRADQFDVLRRRLARAQPADAVVPPVAGLIEHQFERIGLDCVGAGDQGIQLLDRRAAEKGQGDVQRVGAHAATAPVLVQPLAGAVERVAGGVVRPQGKEQPQRVGLGRMAASVRSASATLDQAHRFGGDAFAASGEAEFFGGGRLDVDAVDGDAEVVGDVCRHPRDVRRHLRRLRDDGGIDVADAPAALLQLLGDAAQQDAAVDAGKRRVGVREMAADVAQPRRAQQRVADRVQQHVGVGMAGEPALVGNVDAADDELAIFGKSVHVEAVADPEVIHSASPESGPPTPGPADR